MKMFMKTDYKHPNPNYINCAVNIGLLGFIKKGHVDWRDQNYIEFYSIEGNNMAYWCFETIEERDKEYERLLNIEYGKENI